MKCVLFAVAICIVNPLVILAEAAPTAAEIIKALEQESDQIRTRMEAEITAKRASAIQKLQAIQDSYTREAKLDEAVAIRDRIREIQSGRVKPQPNPELAPVPRKPNVVLQGQVIVDELEFDLPGSSPSQTAPLEIADENQLPPNAAKIDRTLEQETELIRVKFETEIAAKRAVAIRKLQEIQDAYSRDTKLDEALEVRELIRNLKSAGLKPLPNPGALLNYRGQIDKVMLFEVVGSLNGSIYGSEIYTDDSSLSAAAVHSGALRPGQKGIVKVTILPGQDAYLGTQRNSLTSSPYGPYPGSYKVQALFRGNRPPSDVPPPAVRPAVVAPPDQLAIPVKNLPSGVN